jgi:hypothetical protein
LVLDLILGDLSLFEMATYGLTSGGRPKKPTTRRIRPSAANSLKSIPRNRSDPSGLNKTQETRIAP